MKIKTIEKKWTSVRGASCRCPVCGKVNTLRTDPEFWWGIGLEPWVRCIHNLGIGYPHYATEGTAIFLFAVERRAA